MSKINYHNRVMNFVAANIDSSDNQSNTMLYKPDVPKKRREMNVYHFCRLFTIGEIPIIDFIIIYLLLYFLNKIYFQCCYKLVLIAAIFTTILFNITTNKNVRQSGYIIIIIVLGFLYLFKLSLAKKG